MAGLSVPAPSLKPPFIGFNSTRQTLGLHRSIIRSSKSVHISQQTLSRRRSYPGICQLLHFSPRSNRIFSIFSLDDLTIRWNETIFQPNLDKTRSLLLNALRKPIIPKISFYFQKPSLSLTNRLLHSSRHLKNRWGKNRFEQRSAALGPRLPRQPIRYIWPVDVDQNSCTSTLKMS